MPSMRQARARHAPSTREARPGHAPGERRACMAQRTARQADRDAHVPCCATLRHAAPCGMGRACLAQHGDGTDCMGQHGTCVWHTAPFAMLAWHDLLRTPRRCHACAWRGTRLHAAACRARHVHGLACRCMAQTHLAQATVFHPLGQPEGPGTHNAGRTCKVGFRHLAPSGAISRPVAPCTCQARQAAR